MRGLAPLRSAEFFARRGTATRHELAASAAETLTLSELLAMAKPAEAADWETLTLGYGDTRGSQALRDAIAGTYERVTAADVLAFSGGKEAIYAAVSALTGSGDHVLVLTPTYQPLEEIPWSRAEVSAVPLRPEQGWALDLDEVEAALRPNSRLICINFPHNPTGALLDRTIFASLVDLAARHDLWILSDEVYRGLERNATERLPAMADAYDRGLSLDVMSKTYGLPGLRTGWIATRDPAALTKIAAFDHYLADGIAGPSEILARIALGARERIVERNLAIIEHNLALLDQLFNQHMDMFDWAPPRAGCIAFPRYKGRDGVESFCARGLAEAGIALLPASIYRSRLAPTPGDRFRIGFGKRSTPAGIAAFSAFLADTGRNHHSSDH